MDVFNQALNTSHSIPNPLICILTILFLSGSISGEDLFVSVNGKDSSSCSRSTPCFSIMFALLQGNDGDTVHVSEGFYNETGSSWPPFPNPQNRTVRKAVDLIGEGTVIFHSVRGLGLKYDLESPNMNQPVMIKGITFLGCHTGPFAALTILE